MKKFVVLLIIVILSACAVSRMPEAPSPFVSLSLEQSLWRMRLGEDETGFTALLGLRLHDEVVDMVVLDPTGYKLFEGSVDRQGNLRIKKVMPLVQERGLPEYLAESCHRIFLRKPGHLPREGNWFSNIRLVKEQGIIRKIASLASFTVWDIAYYQEKDNAGISRIVMRWLLFKPTLTLERM